MQKIDTITIAQLVPSTIGNQPNPNLRYGLSARGVTLISLGLLTIATWVAIFKFGLIPAYHAIFG